MVSNMKRVKENNIDCAQVNESGKRRYSSSSMSYLDVTVDSPILTGSVVDKNTRVESTAQEVNEVTLTSTDFDISWE